MNLYAILSEDQGSVIAVRELEDAVVVRLRADGNPKGLRIRLAVEGTRPTPSASQVVIQTGWDIGGTTATRTWGLRGKTSKELAEHTRTATRDQLIASAIERIDRDLPRITTAVGSWDAATAAQRWSVMKELLELAHFMARVQKAQLNQELQ